MFYNMLIKKIISIVLNYKKIYLLSLYIMPILIFFIHFTYISITVIDSYPIINLITGIISTIGYYFILTVLIIFIFIKRKAALRSPFKFILGLNSTNNKDYWEENQDQPCRRLVGAEIGVMDGEHAKIILKYLNISELILVDPFQVYIDAPIKKKLNWDFDKMYLDVKNKFLNNSRVKIYREYSQTACALFDDNYFDFIYIDADHSYEQVKLDLENWFPKLKQFGVICGDDYGRPVGYGVVKAVNEFAFSKKLVVQIGDDHQFWFVKV